MSHPKEHDVEIIFSTNRFDSVTSRLIKWHMGACFSHVCLKIYSRYYDRTLIYEASAGDVHSQLYDNWLKNNKIIDRFSINVSADRKKEVIQFCIDHLENKYSIWALVGMYLEDKFKLKTRLGVDGNDKFICSEFTYLCLQDELKKIVSELSWPLNSTSDHIDPKEIYQMLVRYRQHKHQEVLSEVTPAYLEHTTKIA